MTDEKRPLRVDWVQATAGALTAVSSAVLLSTVGVAGTVIGAAVGSVVATVGNAVYSHYIALSKERVAAATLVATRVHRTTARDAPPTSGSGYHLKTLQLDRVEAPDEQDGAATEGGDDGGRARWREALSGLPWKRISLVAAVLFVVAMGLIVSFELLTGRAVSTYTGGSSDGSARTSIPGLGGRPGGAADSDSGDPDDPTGTSEDGSGRTGGAGGADGSANTGGGTDTGTQSGTGTGSDPGARTGTAPRGGADSDPTAQPSADLSATPTPSPAATPTPSVAPSQSPAQ